MNKIYNKGAYPTMITPYKKDGSVDVDMVKKYVHWYHDNGCDGIFSVCQSSEIFFLTQEERVLINKTVYDEVQKIAENGGRRMTVVSSGHVADDIETQAEDLNQLADSGTDALILITNRLAKQDEDDDLWIENAEKLLEKLPSDIALGLYECPYPYKRLLSEKVLNWCLENGRFRFIKDTCCDAAIIDKRMQILKDTPFLLFNANCQTLLASLQSGAAGYCGIMCNYHPKLYVWLCSNFEKQPEKAKLIQSFLGTAGFTEVGLPYPLTAKYHMCLEGLETENIARNRNSNDLTDYARMCIEQMRDQSQFFETLID